MNVDLERTNNLEVQNDIEKTQNNFLKNTLGNVINNVVDIGIKAALPNLIEDEVINVKDAILENGFKAGLQQTIETAVNFGKSAIGIVTGKFDNANQVELAVKKGGIIDSVSNLLDASLKVCVDKKVINKDIASLIKNGKNAIEETLTEKIESTLETQVKSVEKLQSYCEKWNDAYNTQNFSKMESNFKNIEKYIKQTIPLENTIKEARKIENLHNLIKNNGGNFDLSNEQKKLAEILTK